MDKVYLVISTDHLMHDDGMLTKELYLYAASSLECAVESIKRAVKYIKNNRIDWADELERKETFGRSYYPVCNIMHSDDASFTSVDVIEDIVH